MPDLEPMPPPAPERRSWGWSGAVFVIAVALGTALGYAAWWKLVATDGWVPSLLKSLSG